MTPHPTAVYIERKEVRHGRFWTSHFNRRLPVHVETETAPITAVPYSAFFGVGRDAQHVTPHIWRTQDLPIQDKLSIVAPLGSPRVVTSLSALTVPGSRALIQNPIVGRTNISSPGQESLSQKATLYPPLVFGPEYAKIM